MIRFLMALFGKEYETCKSCQTLKEQLAFVNEEKKQLTQTLIDIVKPQPPIIHQIPTSQEIPIPAVASFSRRRAIYEQRDREAARTLKDSQFVAKPDNPQDKVIDKAVEELEKELSIESPEGEK